MDAEESPEGGSRRRGSVSAWGSLEDPGKDRRTLLKQSRWLSNLRGDILDLLGSAMKERPFKAGDLLMKQGEPGDFMLVLAEGSVEVSVSDPDGVRHALATVEAVNVLGEMSLLTHEPRNADVRATTDGWALVLKSHEFEWLVGKHNAIAVVLTHLVAERLGQGERDGLGEKVFHGYRIKRRLGLGAMSVVYEATELATNRRVALKMMSHRLIYEEGAIQRFEREVGIVESLEHPNVGRVYGRFPAYGTYFMVMEYCDGPTLEGVINRCAPVPQEQVMRILGQLAKALHHVHEFGVVHQDLKPANVMLRRDGSVMLVDFGIARPRRTHAIEGAAVPENMPSGSGTPLYMAPEQLRHGQVGARTDIYAVGCMTYEMLTGYSLFPDDSLRDMVRSKFAGHIPHSDAIMPDLCAELYDVISRSLCPRLEDRTLELSELTPWADTVDPALVAQAMD